MTAPTEHRQTEVPESPTARPDDRGTTPQASAGEHHLAELLEAFELLSHRGIGLSAWAAPFRDDPLAFLLDTVSDAARIWNAHGDLVYENRAATQLGVGGSHDAAIEVLLV